MAIKIETPAVPKGTQEQQMRKMYSFLFRLSEKLNVALNNLTEDNFSSATLMKLNSAGSTNVVTGGSNKADIQKTYNELKSLIINTAKITKKEIDELYIELESNYEALSKEWGSYQENINTTITTTAESTIANYNFFSRLDALDEAIAGFSSYIVESEGYIKPGFIDKDENGVPIVGIAIGQNLKSTTVIIDGVEYEDLNDTQFCAFYTAEKVSFRINGREVAYLSNDRLFIYGISVMGPIDLSGMWRIISDGYFEIKWIGDE